MAIALDKFDQAKEPNAFVPIRKRVITQDAGAEYPSLFCELRVELLVTSAGIPSTASAMRRKSAMSTYSQRTILYWASFSRIFR